MAGTPPPAVRFSLLKLAICAKPPPKGTPPAPPKGIPPARNTFGPLWGYFGSLWVHFGATLRSCPVPCELKPVPYELKVTKVLAFLKEYKENHKPVRAMNGKRGFSVYSMYIQCMFNVYSMYMQCIFKITKYDLADARCTRCRSPPTMQLV